MSDRIAVMDHGNLVQVGTPQEIYYKPKSEFVAKFFGENNLLPAALDVRGALPVIDSPLGKHAATAKDLREILLAIRPESFSLHDGRELSPDERISSAKLESVVFLGASTQLSVSLGSSAEHRVKIRVPTAQSMNILNPGADVMLRWSEADVSFLPRG